MVRRGMRTGLIASASGLALFAAVPAAAQVNNQDAGNQQPDNPVTVGGPARPQAAAPADEGNNATDVVVTGSRIARRNLQSGQPTLTIDSAYIDQRGFSNIADALNSLPSFGVPGSSRAGGQAGAFGSGQNFVNFFGLGDQRTLVVVNGRRFVSSNSASIFGPTGSGLQVDLNVIPTLLIDRTETIAVGGAPIYGSDAIAGTINIITKRKFNGLVVDGQYGVSELGDATDARVRALVGKNFAEGRGNITIAAEYNKQGGLTLEDRPDSRLNSFFTTPLGTSPFRNVYIADRRIPALNQNGVPLVTDFIPLAPGQAQTFGFQPSVTNAAGQPLAFDPQGNLVPIDFGQQTGNLINFNGGNGFVLPNTLLAPVERYLVTGLADYDLSPNVRLFFEGWYANSRGEQLRNQPVYNTALFDAAGTPDGNLILNVNNPFLSPAARATIQNALATNPAADAPDTFYLGRANTDLISGAGSSTVELYRFVAGTDVNFRALGQDMKLQVVGNYGRSTTQGGERVLVQQNFQNALNAVRDANGNIVCAPGAVNAPIPTISSTCAPINPFGQQISQAARDYVTTTANPRQVNEQWVVTASLTGNLFNIWGGPVGFALGYEHRNESANFDPGAYYFGLPDPNNPGQRTQFGRSIPIDPVRGSFYTNEGFAELSVPLIGNDQRIPLVRSLELHGAARYIENSFAGGDFTYTGDARWEVLPGISFRGNYTRSVRAPAITELTNPTSQIFTTANDPCDSRFINSGPNPARRAANCQAAGLPAAGINSNIVDATARGTLSGNANLRNEIADAYVLGAIVRPGWLPRFNLTVDWVDIRLKSAITSLDATQVLQGCYDAATFPSTLCNNFTRNAAGQVTFIQTGYANAATQNFRGLLVDLGYSLPTPFLGAQSKVSLQGNYQYTDELVLRVGEGDRTTLRNSVGYSPHKANVNLYYTVPGFSWAWQWQYFGPTRVAPDEPITNRDFPNVGAVSFFNTTLSADVNKQFTLRFVINNLLGERTPFPSPAGGGTVTYFDGILGRNFRISATARF